MSDNKIGDVDQNFGEQGQPEVQGKQGLKVDPGAKRNLYIIGGVVVVAVAAVAALAMSNTGPQVQEGGLPSSKIDRGMTGAAGSPTALTSDELERLDRVTTAKADAAAEKGSTFIPAEIPMAAASAPPPPVEPPPPSVNYNYQQGSQGGVDQAEQQRQERILRGLDKQVQRIVELQQAPTSVSAPRYEAGSQGAQGPQSGANAARATQSASAAPAADADQPTVLGGFHLAAAELISPIDTERTAFASARVVSGPAAGSILYGTSEIVGDVGVRVKFNMMVAPGGQRFQANAVALDPQVSHDTLSATVDRKIFERYVLPIVGVSTAAYLEARGEPGQETVVGPGNTPVVVTPSSTAKQAAFKGASAGISQAVTEYQRAKGKPSAYLGQGSSVGVLFLEDVKPVKSSGPQLPVGNWAPASGGAPMPPVAQPGAVPADR